VARRQGNRHTANDNQPTKKNNNNNQQQQNTLWSFSFFLQQKSNEKSTFSFSTSEGKKMDKK